MTAVSWRPHKRSVNLLTRVVTEYIIIGCNMCLRMYCVTSLADKEEKLQRPESAGSEQSMQSKSSTTRTGSRARRKRAQRRKKEASQSEQPKSMKEAAETIKTRYALLNRKYLFV